MEGFHSQFFLDIWKAAAYYDYEASFILPDTFYISQNRIDWLFTSRTGKILRKKQLNSTVEAVRDFFTKKYEDEDDSSSSVAAEFVLQSSSSHGCDDFQEHQDQICYFRQLNITDVCEQLVDSFRGVKTDGYGLHRTTHVIQQCPQDESVRGMIRVEWCSDGFFRVQKRVNFYESFRQSDKYKEYLIFEDESVSVEQKMFAMNENTKASIRKICKHIAEGMHFIHNERGPISQLTLFFREHNTSQPNKLPNNTQPQLKYSLLGCSQLVFARDSMLNHPWRVSYCFKMAYPKNAASHLQKTLAESKEYLSQTKKQPQTKTILQCACCRNYTTTLSTIRCSKLSQLRMRKGIVSMSAEIKTFDRKDFCGVCEDCYELFMQIHATSNSILEGLNNKSHEEQSQSIATAQNYKTNMPQQNSHFSVKVPPLSRARRSTTTQFQSVSSSSASNYNSRPSSIHTSMKRSSREDSSLGSAAAVDRMPSLNAIPNNLLDLPNSMSAQVQFSKQPKKDAVTVKPFEIKQRNSGEKESREQSKLDKQTKSHSGNDAELTAKQITNSTQVFETVSTRLASNESLRGYSSQNNSRRIYILNKGKLERSSFQRSQEHSLQLDRVKTESIDYPGQQLLDRQFETREDKEDQGYRQGQHRYNQEQHFKSIDNNNNGSQYFQCPLPKQKSMHEEQPLQQCEIVDPIPQTTQIVQPTPIDPVIATKKLAIKMALKNIRKDVKKQREQQQSQANQPKEETQNEAVLISNAPTNQANSQISNELNDRCTNPRVFSCFSQDSRQHLEKENNHIQSKSKPPIYLKDNYINPGKQQAINALSGQDNRKSKESLSIRFPSRGQSSRSQIISQNNSYRTSASNISTDHELYAENTQKKSYPRILQVTDNNRNSVKTEQAGVDNYINSQAIQRYFSLDQ